MNISGTREWSSHSANCIIGCAHDCRYCYARYNAVRRFGRVRPGEWSRPRVRETVLRKRWKKIDGVVMFPTTHDITPEVLDPCVRYLRNILQAGNQVLIVSKPHVDCIARLCREFAGAADQILCRFTIGADDDRVLAYWEPGAPTFSERLASLQLAHREGFQTSVSIEPMLDSAHVGRLVAAIDPHVTETIWIGKLNGIRSRVEIATDEDRRHVAAIEAGQTDPEIRRIYAALKNNPKIRWKESIKQILGLPELDAAPRAFESAPPRARQAVLF